MADDGTRDWATVTLATDLLRNAAGLIAQLKALQISIDDSVSANDEKVEAVEDIQRQIVNLKAEVEGIIGQNIPEHEWNGPVLKLRNPDGEWGIGVDLTGPQGPQGGNWPSWSDRHSGLAGAAWPAGRKG